MIGFHVVYHLGSNEIYSTALFVARQTPIHPVVEGNKGDTQKASNLFSAKKLLLTGRWGRNIFDEGIIKVRFDRLFDPTADIVFGGYVKGRHWLIFDCYHIHGGVSRM
jgi:hypothetical protein